MRDSNVGKREILVSKNKTSVFRAGNLPEKNILLKLSLVVCTRIQKSRYWPLRHYCNILSLKVTTAVVLLVRLVYCGNWKA